MIREMQEHHLQNASSEEICGMVADYSHWNSTPEEIAKAAELIDELRKQPPGVRAVVAGYLQSGDLFCKECGQTSCIHGYPDY